MKLSQKLQALGSLELSVLANRRPRARRRRVRRGGNIAEPCNRARSQQVSGAVAGSLEGSVCRDLRW